MQRLEKRCYCRQDVWDDKGNQLSGGRRVEREKREERRGNMVGEKAGGKGGGVEVEEGEVNVVEEFGSRNGTIKIKLKTRT